MPLEQDQVTATVDLHKKFAMIGPAVPEIRSQTDRHRHTQTNRSQFSTPLPGQTNDNYN